MRTRPPRPPRPYGAGHRPSLSILVAWRSYLTHLSTMPFFSVRKGIRSGPVTSSLPRGAVTDVEAASAPPVVCATGRGVAALPLLLVSNIVLFRVQGCEEGLEISAGGI